MTQLLAHVWWQMQLATASSTAQILGLPPKFLVSPSGTLAEPQLFVLKQSLRESCLLPPAPTLHCNLLLGQGSRPHDVSPRTFNSRHTPCLEAVLTNCGCAVCMYIHAGVPLGYANDHGTYMGIDVNNGQCAVDQSVYNAGRTSDRTECASV